MYIDKNGRYLGAILVAGLRALGAFSILIMYFAVARQVGQLESGVFMWGLTLVMILTPISLFGIHIISLRMLSVNRDDPAKVSSLIVRMSIIGLIVSALFSLFFYEIIIPLFSGFSIDSFSLPVVMMFMPSVILNAMSLLFSNQLQGVGSSEKSIFILSISTPLMMGVLVYFFDPDRAIQLAVLYLIASSVTAIIGGLWVVFLVTPSRAIVEVDSFFSRSGSLFLVNMMVVIVNWGPQLVSGFFCSSIDVAVFSVAQRIGNVAAFVLIISNYILSPIFAKHWHEGNFIYLERVVLMSTFFMSLMGFLSVIVIIPSSEFLMSLFGEGYERGAILLSIIALGQCFNVCTGSVNALLSMTGHEASLRDIFLLSGGFSIVFSVFALYNNGVLGGAILVAATLVLQNIYAVHRLRKETGINLWRAYSPSYIRSFF